MADTLTVEQLQKKVSHQQALIDELVVGLKEIKADLLAPNPGDGLWVCGELEDLITKAERRK